MESQPPSVVNVVNNGNAVVIEPLVPQEETHETRTVRTFEHFCLYSSQLQCGSFSEYIRYPNYISYDFLSQFCNVSFLLGMEPSSETRSGARCRSVSKQNRRSSSSINQQQRCEWS